MTMHKSERTSHARLAKSAPKAKPAPARSAKQAKSGDVIVRGERIEFRVSPGTKELLVRAAELRGGNLTSFVLESAQERAVEVIERFERLRLTNADRDRMLAAFENPPAPAEALRRAFRKHA